VVSVVVTIKRLGEHVQEYAKHENVSDKTFYAVDVKNVWAEISNVRGEAPGTVCEKADSIFVFNLLLVQLMHN
jgi:hypothetical protein